MDLVMHVQKRLDWMLGKYLNLVWIDDVMIEQCLDSASDHAGFLTFIGSKAACEASELWFTI